MTSIQDIAGANATVQIVLPAPARWVQVAVTGTGTARIGDSNVTASRGLPVVAGGAPLLFPPIAPLLFYQKGEISAYIPTGATLSVIYKEGQ
jgi:hypothetical protein